MKQIITNIYQIDEHPNKQAVYDWIRENWHDLAQHYIDDLVQSLETLSNEIGGKFDYAISSTPDRGEFIRITDYDKIALNKLYKKRKDCPLTGMCYDYDVIEHMKNDSLNLLLDMIHKETEYIYSEIGLFELCEANEYYFNIFGKIETPQLEHIERAIQ